MSTIILNISYYGAPFSGFARQPEQLTVQGNIESALTTIFQRKIDTVCAGRTDSGVHAKHQYVSFEVTDDEAFFYQDKLFKIQNSLESLTHDDIHILSVEIKFCEFSARFDAKMRKYSYFIANQKSEALVMRDFSWHIPKPLNIEAMKKSSKYLIGEHDFKSFCVAASSVDKPTHRNISEINFVSHQIFGDSILEIQVFGNAFLHSMVRTLVGTLVKIGLGHREPE